MLLSTGFRLRPGEVFSVVGGGGKTTLMFRMAEEIVDAGMHVITTTTTRIFSSQIDLAPFHLALENPAKLSAELGALLECHSHILITKPPESELGKTLGIASEHVNEIRDTIGISNLSILVEADGSRMRPFKGPAVHEPVIPSCTTLVAPIVGADIFGQPLDEVNVHRAHVVSDLLGVRMGDLVNPDLVARLLLHPQGGGKGIPAGARLVPFINKVETHDRLRAARDTARKLLRGGVHEVLLGATTSANPVCERWGRVAVIILAAGGSTRMAEYGEIKQLLPWGSGTLLTRAVDVANQSDADQVVVVVGCQSNRVESAIKDRELTIAHNLDWQSGQSGSIRAGLEVLGDGVSGAIFLLVDQPNVSTELLNAVIRLHRESGAAMVAPRAGGRRANPVLFDRELWPEMCRVSGDIGGREMIDNYPDRLEFVDWGEEILEEINTPEDYVGLREASAGD
ncbi:MAG: putative selenium-dependent hydroxylase accessory protein YqeC [Anaerolineales bacterium]|nr:putative selenium-dependent hydroxylase accessory protein YqeC [Anaerolineales bacterium]